MPYRREDERLPISGAVRIFWEDEDGEQHLYRADAKDVSASGLSVTVKVRVPLRTLVQVESLVNQVQGSAKVRRCEQKGLNYVVGLEFVGGTKQSKMRYS